VLLCCLNSTHGPDEILAPWSREETGGGTKRTRPFSSPPARRRLPSGALQNTAASLPPVDLLRRVRTADGKDGARERSRNWKSQKNKTLARCKRKNWDGKTHHQNPSQTHTKPLNRYPKNPKAKIRNYESHVTRTNRMTKNFQNRRKMMKVARGMARKREEQKARGSHRPRQLRVITGPAGGRREEERDSPRSWCIIGA
jgi:hypothetical protein